MAKKTTKAGADAPKVKKLNPFQRIIKDYLDKRATEDELFAKTYAKPNKSIEKCCSFIYGEMRKRATDNVAAATDEEVFGLAVHYYDEDNLPIDKKSEKEITQTSATVKVAAVQSNVEDNDLIDVEVPTFDFELF